jgi:two-component system chemotaxis response regulator CheY
MHFLEQNRKAAHAVTVFIAPRMEIPNGYGIEFAIKKFSLEVSMAILVTITDDSMLSRKNIRKALPPELDAEITEACNGQEALAAVYGGKAELLFLDLQMPIMDGFEVLAELQKREHNTVVIVISADIQPKAVERVLALGALRFLQKPLNQQQLHQVLLEVGLL